MTGTEKYLIDTNILIYFFNGNMTDSQKSDIINIFNDSFIISVISKIEFLGFKDYLDAKKYDKAKEFINNSEVIPLSDKLVESVITIRQKYNLKLGDSIIGATALINNLTIVTRNTGDFNIIDGIKIYNPYDSDIGKVHNPDMNIDIIPNPRGKFNISFITEKPENITIQVFDALGKQVYSEKKNKYSGSYNNTVDLSNLANGIYSVIVKVGEKITTEKISIAK